MKNRMTVRESTTTHILSGHTNSIPLFKQRGVGQGLCHSPIERERTTSHFATILINLFDLLLQHYAIGYFTHFMRDSLQGFEIKPGISGCRQVMADIG